MLPPSPALRRYQARTLQALLRGIERHRGATFTVMYPRQAGKNEVSAALVACLLLTHARRGGSIVVCAPTLTPQAALSLERTRAELVRFAHLAPPAGQVRRMDNVLHVGDARAVFLSASPHAHVAGHTASLALIADEAQDIDPDWFNRQFRPMAASTAAPTVMFGTPWDGRTLLDEAVRANRRAGGAFHHEVGWREVAAGVPAYGAYVRAERERLGAEHPLFVSQYELRTTSSAGRLLTPGQLRGITGETHPPDGPRPGERYVAGLDLGGDRPGADATVLITGALRGTAVEIVGCLALEGVAYEDQLDALSAELTRWGTALVCVDGTGLGGPLADTLGERVACGVERVVFTPAVKSELGYALLAAANTRRLAVPAAFERTLAELRACEAAPGPAGRLRWGNPQGHDDHAAALALCLRASQEVGPPRVARARARS